MKIRIHNNSIRLRLNRTEVEQIGNGDAVDCSTRFPAAGAFGYRLSVAAQQAEPGALFAAGTIEVVLPTAQALHWANTETEVSIHGSQVLPDGALELLIEKDFECLDPRAGEDQSNRFQNPKAMSQ